MSEETKDHGRTPAAPREVKPVEWGELPDNVRRALSSLPMDEWSNVMVTICPSELMLDATAIVSMFVRVWEKSRAAEDFRVDRLTVDEREKFRQEFAQALQVIAGTTIRLGVRAKLYGELQLEKALLTCYAKEVWESTWTKAMTRAFHSNGAPANPAKGTAHPKDQRPAPGRPKPEAVRGPVPQRAPVTAPTA